MSIPTQAIGTMGQVVPGQLGQGFPPSLGMEQAFGAPWSQQPYQVQLGQPQYQQAIQQLTTQILPIVHQVITTQVMQQVPQIVAQLAAGYLAPQFGQFGQFGQQYSLGGQFPWGSALAGTPRPYPF